jgi:4-amino-4-deoxy-L-arabinose transferase-like glycosyltransferase
MQVLYLLAAATENQSNPGSGVLLLIAIVGAIFDWRYVRAGGKPSTRTDLKYLVVIVLTGVVILVWLGLRGASARALGSLTGFGFVLTFLAWEIARWNVRRKNLLPPKSGPHS